MKNILLCICDPDEAYLNRLNGYMQQKEHSPFLIRTYTEPEKLHGEAGYPGYLLISSVWFECLCRDMKGLAEGDWFHVTFLNEGGSYDPVLSTRQWEDIVVDCVDKYQSAHEIYAHIARICLQRESAVAADRENRRAKTVVTGVYAADFHRLQAAFAQQLARYHSVRGPCLYLPFSQICGEGPPGPGLTELILAIKEKERHPDAVETGAVEPYVHREGNLAVVPPAACPYDLQEISEQEWYDWLCGLCAGGEYASIVLNFASTVPPLCLLTLCGEIYLPFLQEEGAADCTAFANMLRFMGENRLADRMRPVRVDAQGSPAEGFDSICDQSLMMRQPGPDL